MRAVQVWDGEGEKHFKRPREARRFLIVTGQGYYAVDAGGTEWFCVNHSNAAVLDWDERGKLLRRFGKAVEQVIEL